MANPRASICELQCSIEVGTFLVNGHALHTKILFFMANHRSSICELQCTIEVTNFKLGTFLVNGQDLNFAHKNFVFQKFFGNCCFLELLKYP